MTVRHKEWMRKLQLEEARALQAASGWLDLGSPSEAEAELRFLPEDLQAHPEVLLIRWEIQAKRREWAASLETAKAIVSSSPETLDGWIKHSFSLHELKRTEEAWEALLGIQERFADASIVPYNLACYACQLGRVDQGRELLARAMRLAKKAGEGEQDVDEPLDQQIGPAPEEA